MGPVRSEPGAVWRLTLDSPPANAVGWDLLDALDRALDDVESGGARVLVVRGAGTMFSAGADITLLRRAAGSNDGVAEIARFGHRMQEVYQRVEDLPLPTIAHLNGHALGGGLELALACDLRVAAASARVGLPEAKLGLLPGAGGTQRLPRLAGRGTALRLILRGELATAEWSAAAGIVQWCVPDAEAEGVVADLAAELAALPADTLRAAKHSVGLACTAQGYASEIEQTGRLLSSPATLERVTAFLDR